MPEARGQKGTEIVVKPWNTPKPALNEWDQKRISESKDRQRLIIFVDG